MADFLKKYFTGFGSMMGVMGIIYLFIWLLFGKALHNRKIQLSKRAGWSQIKGEVLTAALAAIGNTLFTSLIYALDKNGKTQLYKNFGQWGIGYEILTVVVMVLISDAWFYWTHRWMHHPKIYKYVHALHHKSLDVNPFTSNAFHLLESVLLTVWVLPLFLLMPISFTALGVMQALGMLNNLKSHLGYELFPQFFRIPPFNLLVTATNHSLHHTQYNGNYGLFFRFWDIVCKTELKTTTTLFQEIHERTDSQVVDNTVFRTLTIDQLVRETKDSISVYFKPTDPLFYQYQAGQHLNIKLKIKGKTHERCFSLSSTPGIDNFLRITVKRKGEVSQYFLETAQAGDNIEALYPVGDFALQPNQSNSKNYIFVAGGSGITPLFSMIRKLLQEEPNSSVHLRYANQAADAIIFKQALTNLAAKHPQFHYQDFISGQRRIAAQDLLAQPNSEYFICGPEAMTKAMVNSLKLHNVPAEKINVEHFADGYVPWLGLF
jgi:ring-1,2-phenylacetyl-CoA epoxidase subunit PaaE